MNAQDIADFLQDNPDFFEQHAQVFAGLSVPGQHGASAVSLAQRQIMTLRDRVHQLEQHVAHMSNVARENEAIDHKLWGWTRQLLLHRTSSNLPQVAQQGLAQSFSIPQVALKLWDVEPAHASNPHVIAVNPNTRSFVDDLRQPYCGPNQGFDVCQWLEHASSPGVNETAISTQSCAIVPLRNGISPRSFGVIVLGSAEAKRFTPGMGDLFLARIGEISASLFAQWLPASPNAVA